jgi:hypothetical protein
MKESQGKGFEVMHRYEIRSRKRKMLYDYNKSSMDDEHGLKERGKKKFLIKQKVEAAEGINYSHQVKELKQQIWTLQQHNQELEK